MKTRAPSRLALATFAVAAVALSWLRAAPTDLDRFPEPTAGLHQVQEARTERGSVTGDIASAITVVVLIIAGARIAGFDLLGPFRDGVVWVADDVLVPGGLALMAAIRRLFA